MRSRKIRVGAVAAMAVTGLVLAGCASDDDTNEPQSAGGTWPGEGMSECEGLEQLAEFGDLTGTTVGVYTSILPPEQEAHEASYELFTTCTGAEVDYDGSDQFETQLVVRVKAGNAPDIAYIPQPGLLQTVVASGEVEAAPTPTADNVDEFFGEDWKGYGTVEDTFYAAPLGASVKSFVWYSPSMFSDNGWEVPETWDCPRCGLPGGRDAENPPAAPRTEPYKTHLAYVKERRSDADGEAILEEALGRLRASREL